MLIKKKITKNSFESSKTKIENLKVNRLKLNDYITFKLRPQE